MLKDQPKPTGEGLLVFPRLLNFFINLKEPSSKLEEQVIQDIVDRALVGKERYETFLRTENGRDARVDAYQELIDYCMYLMQLMLEMDPEEDDSDVRDMLIGCLVMLGTFREKFL